ncbi:hypothetical protein Vau01_122040 [Virgisporangium aurantiacum]|uniref:Uncharacterized protein n=1 Tax=Virgisporangium aurantiacum TaxID=175570 RepID=A0A8J3ZN60_9ACTN|nr:hypothetical protein Vau01_122040 [Virgisporangium aurantiacum]
MPRNQSASRSWTTFMSLSVSAGGQRLQGTNRVLNTPIKRRQGALSNVIARGIPPSPGGKSTNLAAERAGC